MDFSSLHQDFTAFIGLRPQLPVLAPAYFMADRLSTHADETYSPITEHRPYDTFWLVYQSNNGPLGFINNFLLIQGNEARLFIKHVMPGGAMFGIRTDVVQSICNFDLDDPAKFEVFGNRVARAVAETLPEIRECLSRIMTNETVEAERTPYLKRLNKQRNRNHLKSIPPFTIVKSTRIVRPSNGATGTGVKQPPHWREGYTRTMRKSGKQVQVAAYAVHGGGGVKPRDYKVFS